MNDIMTSIAAAVAIGIIGWIGGRFSIKTKSQVKSENIDTRLKRIEAAQPVILECHLATLVALKRGKVNGECDAALEKLNNYLLNK